MMLVLDIDNVRIIGKNKKYAYRGGKVLSAEYRDFKRLIHFACRRTHINPPYRVTMELHMPHDIDAPVQPILDGMNGRAIKDDRYILQLIVNKTLIKRGTPGKIRVWVETIDK